MSKIIISDSNCLTILYEIGGLEFLNKLFGQVFTTPEITKKLMEIT